ncbi:MAG: HAD family hydrolase [Ignavibacteriales bacterium]|nr:HAD family hydrolase [Ignavibacteriales bacterium]
MANHAVFFDRDGTINIDPGYLGNPEQVELYKGVTEGLVQLKKLGFKIIVVSNQSGIARGLITKEDVDSINNKINEILLKDDVQIDAFYYCPYHPKFNTTEECECRKPSTKMIYQAAEDWNIDLKKSYLTGDMVSDVECGLNAGLKTILIKTTITEEKISYLLNEGKIPTFIAPNFLDACNFIVNDFIGGN